MPLLGKRITEEILVQQLVQGSRDAFCALFKIYHPKVMGLCIGVLKSQIEAEDMTQDIFIKLWDERAKLIHVNHLSAYIFRMSKNRLLNHLESKQVRINHLQSYKITEIEKETPHDLLVASDLQLLVDMVVEQMPDQRRVVYKMSREQGLSNSEIAEKIGVTKKTVENHINSALKALRSVIKTIITLFFC